MALTNRMGWGTVRQQEPVEETGFQSFPSSSVRTVSSSLSLVCAINTLSVVQLTFWSLYLWQLADSGSCQLSVMGALAGDMAGTIKSIMCQSCRSKFIFVQQATGLPGLVGSLEGWKCKASCVCILGHMSEFLGKAGGSLARWFC